MENEELVARIKAGIDTGDNMLALWKRNRGMICKIARRYSAYADTEDLQQEGYLALYPAIDGYDPDSGVKFLAYATTVIDRAMRRYICSSGSAVRIPEHERAKIREYKQTVNAFRSYLGRQQKRQEIADNMGLNIEQVEQLERSIQTGRMASLDKPFTDGDAGYTLQDTVRDPNNLIEAAEDAIQQEQLKAVIWEVVDTLPADQREVIRARYQMGQTLKATGEALGVTLERVRVVQNNGLNALRRGSRARKLLPYYEDIRSRGMHGTGVNTFRHTWTSATERVAMQL